MHNAECTMHNAECTMHNAERTMQNAECTMQNAECTMHNAQCTMHNAQWRKCKALESRRNLGRAEDKMTERRNVIKEKSFALAKRRKVI